jgi:hypothetical protein
VLHLDNKMFLDCKLHLLRKLLIFSIGTPSFKDSA